MQTIFSELKYSGNTLEYKCKNGFKSLEGRFAPNYETSVLGMEHLGKYGSSMETNSQHNAISVPRYFIQA